MSRDRPKQGCTTHVVLVSSRADDHASLRKIFRDSPWELQGAFTGSDGLGLLHCNHRDDIFAVICENNLPDGDWRFLLAEMDKLPVRPNLIVVSHLADERLWAEVLNLGAFDLLLAAPFEASEVLRVTESAWLAWQRASLPETVRRIGPGPAQSEAGSSARPYRASGGI